LAGEKSKIISKPSIDEMWNVFIIGFPLTIGLGLITLGLTLPLFFDLLKSLFSNMEREMSGLIRGFR